MRKQRTYLLLALLLVGSVATATETKSPLKVIAYYFHANVRCPTCRSIEAYGKEAVERAFPSELKAGTIEWRPVNIQLPENRHFVKDYRLFTRSLVLVKVREGKHLEWRNLEKVWDLVGSKPEFVKYVQSGVKDYLGGN